MSSEKKTVLLKITGETLPRTEQGLDGSMLEDLASQVKQLLPTHQFGIVMGGGNLFRGAHRGKLSISANVGHSVGMLATLMNGLIIQDIFQRTGITTHLFTASPYGAVGDEISPQALNQAQAAKECIIFAGGSGNPYFTTDTTAVVRALQLGASELWKGTNVNGVYSEDPKNNSSAYILPQVRYEEAIKTAMRLWILQHSLLLSSIKYPLGSLISSRKKLF